MNYVSEGVYAHLPRDLKALSGEYKNDRMKMKSQEYEITLKIDRLVDEYHSDLSDGQKKQQEISDPKIIISETFR